MCLGDHFSVIKNEQNKTEIVVLHAAEILFYS
jgi:hypothetical protein